MPKVVKARKIRETDAKMGGRQLAPTHFLFSYLMLPQ